MRRIFMMLCSFFLVISLVACSVGDTQLPVTASSGVPTPSIVQSTDVSREKATEELILPNSSATEQEVSQPLPIPPKNMPEAEVPKEDAVHSMQITIGNTSFSATLAKNAATDAFIKLMRNAPVVINMSDYSGFEKVGSLGTNLPTNNSSITTSEGDIVLYNGNQIVAFYGAHSWDYTRLGKIDDLTQWKEVLGDGDVTMMFSIE